MRQHEKGKAKKDDMRSRKQIYVHRAGKKKLKVTTVQDWCRKPEIPAEDHTKNYYKKEDTAK